MKSGRKTLLSGLTAIAVVVAGTIMGSTAASALPAGTTESNTSTTSTVSGVKAAHKKYTGEELFRAAVFGQGEAASKLSGLTTPIEITPEVDAEIGRIVAQLNEDDPSYLPRFAKLAQSGSALKTDQAFRETGEALNTALTELGYTDTTNKSVVSPQCIQVVLFAVAVLVYAGAAVLQVAAVAVSFWYAPSSQTSVSTNDNQLTREKWVASVATALG
jgi:SdpC family antimicrobial peptide